VRGKLCITFGYAQDDYYLTDEPYTTTYDLTLIDGGSASALVGGQAAGDRKAAAGHRAWPL